MQVTDTLTRRPPLGALAVPTSRVERPGAGSEVAPNVGSPTSRRSGGPGTHSSGVRLSWSARHVLVLAVVAGVVGWLAYLNRHAFDPDLWRTQLHVGWAVLALVGMSVTLAGNAWNLMGASPAKLRFWPTYAVQLAGSLVRVVSPAAVGGAAVNVQYLRRSGVGNAASLGTVSVAQTVQLVLALVLLPPVAFAAGADAALLDVDGAVLAGCVLGGLLVLAAAAVLIVRRSPMLEARARLLFGELSRSLRAMAADPRRAAVSMAGAILVSAGLIAALWASAHAFGGKLGVLTAAGVLLLGSSAGNAIPVPGGLGSVDAALVAALTATGTSLTVALPAVALFRLVTLWLPLPAGLVSLGLLRRRGQL